MQYRIFTINAEDASCEEMNTFLLYAMQMVGVMSQVLMIKNVKILLQCYRVGLVNVVAIVTVSKNFV